MLSMAGPVTQVLRLMGADHTVTFAILMTRGVLDGATLQRDNLIARSLSFKFGIQLDTIFVLRTNPRISSPLAFITRAPTHVTTEPAGNLLSK